MATDSFLPTARPAYAVIMWADDTRIFIELPCKDAPPYITAYAKTEGGLSKALGIMQAAYEKLKPPSAPTHSLDHPKIRRFKSNVEATDSQRELARNILRRLKITGT